MGKLTEKQVDRLAGYFLVVLAAAALLKVTGHLFLLADDPQCTFRNEHVRAGLTWSGIVWAFTNTSNFNWQPVAWLSHMLDVQVFGLNPAAHHLVNLVVHIVNTLLLFGVLGEATGSRWRSVFVAAVFAVHPLHVESVAWVAERKDLLCAMFWLLSMRAYLRYAERPGASRYAAVVLFFVAGLLSKAMIVTLPFLILLMDYWPLGRFNHAQGGETPPGGAAPAGEIPGRYPARSAISLVAEKLPLVALAAGAALVAYLAQEGGGAVNPIPLGMRVENALTAYAGYIGKALWPHPLAIYYPHPADIGTTIPAWKVAGASLLLAAVTALAVAARKRRPWLPVGWFWFLGTLVPVIGIVQIGGQAMADRYMYMPIIGLAILAAWSVPDLYGERPFRNLVLPTAAALSVTALAVVSWLQVDRWHDTVTILEHTLSVTSDNWWGERHLGNTYEELGDVDKAALHYENALRISPDSGTVLKDIGRLLAKQGRNDEAIARFRQVLRGKPDDGEARLGLALALDSSGAPDEAWLHYAEVLRTDPNLAEEQYRKGVALLRIGRLMEAMAAIRVAVRVRPANAEAHNNLGVILGQLGKTDEAAAQFREALRLRPGYAEAKSNLEAAAGMNGREAK